MKKIKELIVVEGHNDTFRLKRFLDCDTIETGGDMVNRETLDRIAAAQKSRGVIVFTDPDRPGEHIRSVISRHVPGVKHAFIEHAKAKTDKKVGVEHAEKKDLEESLANCVTFMEETESLSWHDFIDLGLVGHASRREEVCRLFHIGKCNAKTCFKRLNQMGVTARQILEKLNEQSNCD